MSGGQTINDSLKATVKKYNDDYYKQSSKFSEISRNITYGMLATLWIIMFSNGKVILPSIPIIITLCLCFIYLLFDLIHYYSDSFRCRKKIKQLINIYKDNKLIETYKDNNKRNDRIDNYILDVKFMLMIITSISFISSIVLYSTCHF